MISGTTIARWPEHGDALVKLYAKVERRTLALRLLIVDDQASEMIRRQGGSRWTPAPFGVRTGTSLGSAMIENAKALDMRATQGLPGIV